MTAAEDREALTEALAHHSWCTYGQPMVSVTGVVESRGQCNCLPARQEDVGVLLPVVDAIARRRAAEEFGSLSIGIGEALRLTELAPRFWQRVQVGAPTSCWPWTGPTVPFGHGRYDSPVGNLAHRYAWALANLAAPGSRLVRHKCDNPPCCNPRHLELGTYADNAQDAVVRGRAEWTLTTCRKNHRRTPENTSFRSGYPRCLTCERQATHARKHLRDAIYQCPECSSALSVHQMVRHQRKVHGHRVDAAYVRSRLNGAALEDE